MYCIYSARLARARLRFCWLGLSLGLLVQSRAAESQQMPAAGETDKPIISVVDDHRSHTAPMVNARQALNTLKQLRTLLLAPNPTSAFSTHQGVRSIRSLPLILRQSATIMAATKKAPSVRMPSVCWDDALAQLVAYKEEHGNCHVPSRFETADGFKLGKWLSNQRLKYQGKRGVLNESEKSLLEDLGVDWDAKKNAAAQAWEVGYAYLEACKLEHGDCNVPAKYVTEDGYQLGKWVSRQREKYKGKRGGLPESQKARLHALGLIFDFAEENWKEGYTQLEAYKAEHGDCNVPESFATADEFFLGRWLSYYRQKYRGCKDELEEPERSRFEALVALGLEI